MRLEYEEVEDSYDDTTKIRTMTEQAVVPDKGVLLRTTIYSPHDLSSTWRLSQASSRLIR